MTEPASRLLQLLSLLQVRRDWPGLELAERLEISSRTVRRDIERLRELGYRIGALTGPDGGYRLEAGADLPPLLFDDDQAVALAIALETSIFPGSGIEEGAVRALTTLRQVLPNRLRHRLDGMPVTTLPAGPGDARPPAVSSEALVELSAAIRDRRVLRLDYQRPGGEVSRHRVEPHGLVTTGGRWYLLAWDLERDDWRILRVDRLTPRPPHGARFTPRTVPGGSVAAFVSARFKGSDREDRWPCEGSVIIDLPARDVRPFAGDGSVEDLGDDRCRLRAGSWSWSALAAAFLRFDADIDGVDPPSLAEAFGDLARRAARARRVGA
ncbi:MULTISPECIES: helix-turn-helix transcriptional regulator [unclassified Microbacterium]|uniref:helix-turn-helix transcriptional regulator n=1 Tax=unclassified Microbacterium TaxID=2609290 RepID=UPI00097EAD5C|nr:WYL domain-containing protein [Microbacterium sp. JB110]RCS61910.1 WYL domain-containing transcriptional regulator [Microbacterium sp. JB110]SJM66579.1 Transcriptional regulator, DeoR family [Frigoribacterium sp. JB110]